jgi:hypothetical protein
MDYIAFISQKTELFITTAMRTSNPTTFIAGQDVSERNVLLFSGERDYGHYYSLLPVEEKDRLGMSDGLFSNISC